MKGKEGHCRAGSAGDAPQTQEADAANLKAMSTALFSPEAKACYFCPTHSQPQPPLPHPPGRLEPGARKAMLSYTLLPSQDQKAW